jgi:hypothetical protein
MFRVRYMPQEFLGTPNGSSKLFGLECKYNPTVERN